MKNAIAERLSFLIWIIYCKYMANQQQFYIVKRTE